MEAKKTESYLIAEKIFVNLFNLVQLSNKSGISGQLSLTIEGVTEIVFDEVLRYIDVVYPNKCGFNYEVCIGLNVKILMG